MSDRRVEHVSIVPDLSSASGNCKHTDLFSYFGLKPVWWIKDGMFLHDRVNALHTEAGDEVMTSAAELMGYIEFCPVVEWGPDFVFPW